MIRESYGSWEMVDNYNEPRLVAFLCCLPDLSWWACSSLPGGLALVFDSNPISSHFCKEPGPGNQPHFLCLWDCVTVRNSFLLREFQGPHLEFVFLKTLSKSRTNVSNQICSGFLLSKGKKSLRVLYYLQLKVCLIDTCFNTLEQKYLKI